MTLTSVRQTTGGMNDLLASYSNFTALDLPQTVTDAAGQSTTMTYNASGQVLTVTNARNETTTSTYDTEGRLLTVTGAMAGTITTYAYDAYGRVRTVTDSDNYTVTTDYDTFDRPIRITYPDGTYEAMTYDQLHLSSRRDRAGKVTRYSYDALRRLTATRDPAGRVVTQQWSAAGELDALMDANGSPTRWERDVQGRVTREVRADGNTDTLYTYAPRSGRLLTITDPKDQVTTYAYAIDDRRLSMTFTNAQIATPPVIFTYDAAYPRLASMTDGMGVTTYAYHAPGLPGAGQIASVDGPLGSDTITYTYDALGRVESRAIDGTANVVTWGFDALGRVELETNLLGTFSYAYDGVTSRLASVMYPNGQTSTYSYLDNAGDRRLQTIHHKYPTGATLSKFDYSYDAVGNILTWQQQGDSDAVRWTYGYDAAEQLTSAVKSAEPTQAVLTRYAYAYDPAGNRTMEQIDDQVTAASHDALNRLVSQQPTGPLVIAGTVSEPATVTVQGVPAAVTAGNAFTARPDIGVGTNVLAITATDTSNNTATAQYEVDNAGVVRTFTYDANGNLVSDGMRSFEWDAKNQLVGITQQSLLTQFDYDGNGRRTRVRSSMNGQLSNETLLVYCEFEICEERTPSGVTARVVQRLGTLDAGIPTFHVLDHLGSVRHTTSETGDRRFSVDFDPFGRMVASTGPTVERRSFAQLSNVGGIDHGTYREYDAEIGRWLKQDPIGLAGGLNLYGYVNNNPLIGVDPLGLCTELARFPVGLWQLLSTERTFSKKQLTDSRSESPEEGPNFRNSPGTRRGGTLWTYVSCQWTRKVSVEREWRRPIVIMEMCETECGASIQYRQGFERQRKSEIYNQTGWLHFNLPLWVSPAFAGAECQKRIN